VAFLSHPLGDLGEGRCFIYTLLEGVSLTSYKR